MYNNNNDELPVVNSATPPGTGSGDHGQLAKYSSRSAKGGNTNQAKSENTAGDALMNGLPDAQKNGTGDSDKTRPVSQGKTEPDSKKVDREDSKSLTNKSRPVSHGKTGPSSKNVDTEDSKSLDKQQTIVLGPEVKSADLGSRKNSVTKQEARLSPSMDRMEKDRPASVKKSPEQGVQSPEPRLSPRSQRRHSSPAGTVPLITGVGVDAKVVPKKPENVTAQETELVESVRGYVLQLKQMKSYDNPETLDLVRSISQSYWKGTDYRVAITLALCEEGFPALATHALKTLNAMGIFKNDSIWFPSYYFLNTVWNFSDCSPEFATDVADVGMLDLLVANISHKPYVENLSSKNVTYVVKSSLSIMHNVARAPDTNPAFSELRAEEALLPFAQGHIDNEFLQALAVLTLAHISDEMSDFSQAGSPSVINFIVDCMQKALKSEKHRFRGFLASELAEGLAKIATRDNNKNMIIDAGALPVFNEMLKSPDVKEQYAAGQAVWALAFDEESRKRLLNENELMANLEQCMRSSDENVKLNALGAMWILKRKLNERSETRQNLVRHQTLENFAKNVKDRLMFISYSWHDKKKVHKVAKKLKELGYCIWIDTEQMKENILQAMAQGIEDSAVFIMCMSESYKESPNARTEAEYAFKLHKPIIPLMMQKRYRPDGWLGIILGTKLYFNFSGRIPFNEVFGNFLRELESLHVTDETGAVVIQGGSLESAKGPGMSSAKLAPQRQNTYLTMRAWTSEDLGYWLEEYGLQSLKSRFQDFDGRTWCGLLKMKREAPDYFYKLLEEKLNLHFMDILRLSDAINYMYET